jgi:hypothetical protein
MKNLLVVIGALGVTYFAVAGLAEWHDRTVVQNAPTGVSQNSLMEKSKARAAFLEGCTAEGSSASLCGCVFDELEGVIGVNGMVKIGLEVTDPAELPPVVVEAVNRCVAVREY